MGIYIDETLTGNEHCEEIVKKLSRANGILAKARHVLLAHLPNIYNATFSSQVWGQTSQAVIDKNLLLQKKAIRIMSFSNFTELSEPLFKKLNIFKSQKTYFPTKLHLRS